MDVDLVLEKTWKVEEEGMDVIILARVIVIYYRRAVCRTSVGLVLNLNFSFHDHNSYFSAMRSCQSSKSKRSSRIALQLQMVRVSRPLYWNRPKKRILTLPLGNRSQLTLTQHYSHW